MIRRVLNNPAILPQNCYNIDETEVMLSRLGFVKVLISKSNMRNYKGAGVKQTIVTAIKCVSGDSRSLLPLVIWPASTHRSN